MYKKLLVAYDGSAGARAALSQSLVLAGILGSEVWALWVRETVPYLAETNREGTVEEEAGRAYLQKLKIELETAERGEELKVHLHSQAGHPAEKILRYAMEGAFDLIVLGSHGHSAGQSLGHTTDRVSERAPCSVLIVRPEDYPKEAASV